MDGQSEITNLTIIELLIAYVTEVDQRDQCLPMVEYAHNNTIHTFVGKIPFEIAEGRLKLPLMVKPHEKIFATDECSKTFK